MKNLLVVSICLLLNIKALTQNQLPIISNKILNYDAFNNTILINFDLDDADNSMLEVQCKLFSADATTKYIEIVPDQITGDIGYPIGKGINKQISIHFNSALPYQKLSIVLVALDRESINIQEIISKVDSNNLKAQVTLLQGRRNSGNQVFYDQTREYLYTTLNSAVPTRELNFNTGQYNGKNFEATKLGYEKPAALYLIDAHYDSYSNAPGADDNASGVAGVLEAIRILGDYASKKSIRYVLFDLEEAGLVGSTYYVTNQLNPKDSIQGVINFEMIGFYSEQANSQDLPTGFNILFPDAYNQVIANNRKGDFITNVGNTLSYSLRSKFHQFASSYVPELKVISLDVPGNGSIAPDLTRSDHFAFWLKNIPALMITDAANFRNKNYHTIRDSVKFLNFDFMSQVTKASIATLLELAETQHGVSTEISVDLRTAIQDGVNEKISLSNINNILQLNSTININDALIKIYSVSGNLIETHEVDILSNQTNPLTTIQMPAGIYFITLTSDLLKWSGKYFNNGN